MANTGAAMFMRPGKGKTSAALMAAKLLKNGGHIDTILIIAPLRVCYLVWPAELVKWADFDGMTFNILHGPKKVDALSVRADVQIINHDGLKFLFSKPDFIAALGRIMLIIDESSQFRNQEAQRYKYIQLNRQLFDRVVIMTGSPAPRSLLNLWAQVYLLDYGAALGKMFGRYRFQHFDRVGFDWIPKENATSKICAKIASFSVVAPLERAVNEPAWEDHEITVTLPEKVRDTYNQLRRNLIAVLESGEALTAPNAAALTGQLRQLCQGAIYERAGCKDYHRLHTAKLDALAELLDELGDVPTLILYQYHHDADRLAELLKPRGGFADISRSTSRDLDAIQAAFNSDALPFLCGNPRSMGHGLNLQACCRDVIFFAPTWDLEEYEQAPQRVIRQGNPHAAVTVHHLLAAQSIEQVMRKMILAKDLTQTTFLRTLKEIGTC